MRIGVLDSGIGGLNLLYRLTENFPENQYIYYADNLYSPYGSRNVDFLKHRVGEIIKILREENAEIIALGCNTAGSNLDAEFMSGDGYKITSVLPEAYPERERSLIMCTPLTATSPIIRNYVAKGAMVYADPNLVPMIEANISDLSPVVEYLIPRLAPYRAESITLGCTHYIYLRSVLQSELGVRCLEGMDGALRDVGEALRQSASDRYSLKFIFSGKDESDSYMKALAKQSERSFASQ